MVTGSRWSEEKAANWYAEQPFWIGCNFTPSTAVNQLEMWQAESFDAETISRELGWAAGLGMNAVRVFLHDLVWEADPDGFLARIDRFLAIASGHGIQTMLVPFDDCWFPPRAGPQPAPIPGVHNSRWAQSPGHDVVARPAEWGRLERYVKGVVDAFGRDERVCVWDLYNEPGNAFLPLASVERSAAFRGAVRGIVRHFVRASPSLALVRAAFEWARAVDPIQPLTVGLWAPNPRFTRLQLEASDIVSFHQYADAAKLEQRIRALQKHRRPILCTEWLARPLRSRVATHLPIFHEERVGCFNWGLVSGKTQTIHDGWEDPEGGPAPEYWHHDLLHPDGSPYDADEAELLRRFGAPQGR